VRSLEIHARSGPSSRNRAINAIEHLAKMFAQAHAPGSIRHNWQPLQQAAADAGVFEAVVAAMRSAPDVPIMQSHGCCLMHMIGFEQHRGGDGDSDTRRDRAAQAGAIEAAVEAMRLYPQEEKVQAWACIFLAIMATVFDYGSALIRTRRILAANPEVLVEAARASFPQNRMLALNAPKLLEVLRLAAAAP